MVMPSHRMSRQGEHDHIDDHLKSRSVTGVTHRVAQKNEEKLDGQDGTRQRRIKAQFLAAELETF